MRGVASDRISHRRGGVHRPQSFTETITGTGNDNLVIAFSNGSAVRKSRSMITFETAGEAVELVNFNGGSFGGYLLDGDYTISADDNGDRTAAVGREHRSQRHDG